MTPDKDKLNKRRIQREKARIKRERARKRLIHRLIAVAVVLVLCGGLIFFVTRQKPKPIPIPPSSGNTAVSDSVPTAPIPTEPPTRPKEGKTVIHIAAAGDLNVTDNTITFGHTDAGYDFSKTFLDVAPVLSNADLSIVNFEGNLCGEPYGSIQMSAPPQLMQGLADAGVDMVQMANSYSIYNGVQGLAETLSTIRAAGLEPLGAYASNAEAKAAKGYTICDVQGIKVAVVAFTKGMNNLGLPDGSNKCVNLLYKDYATTYRDINTGGITKILKEVSEEKPDFTVALVHWGSEYNEEISYTQKEIRDLMLSHGVNAIIGTHPHLVQTIEYDSLEKTLVAYSLGDFYGDAEVPGSNYSIILDLEVTRDNVTGATSLSHWSYTPIYNLTPKQSGGDEYRIVQINQSMQAYESGCVLSVSEEVYKDMDYVCQRIYDRTNGKG